MSIIGFIKFLAELLLLSIPFDATIIYCYYCYCYLFEIAYGDFIRSIDHLYFLLIDLFSSLKYYEFD